MELTADVLMQVPDLAGVPEAQLEWLIAQGEIREFDEGDRIISRDDPIDHLFIVLEGKVRLMYEQNGNYKAVDEVQRHMITGFLPYSRVTVAKGYGEVIQKTRLFVVPKPVIKEMTTKFYELTAALVHVMTNRAREFTRMNVQSEKMMALGKLSAGLAHELNNPASAIARASRELRKHVHDTPEKFKKATTMQVDPALIDKLTDTVSEIVRQDQECHLSLLQRTEKEDEMETWLEENNIEDAFDFAPSLVEHCLEPADLQKIMDIIGREHFPAALEWLEHVLTTEKMVADIEKAAERISGLVSSIKRYTHMDSAPEKEASDVRSGIKNTLTMLNHKLKKKNIKVSQEYEDDLPRPEIIVGDMNQVWTNLIDNAIDALEDGGMLTIRGSGEKKDVIIEVIDNGHGITEDNLDAIFDPFFTTKAIGEGTGMGLDIVRRIIDQHHGQISVKSGNGETKFTVKLPVTAHD